LRSPASFDGGTKRQPDHGRRGPKPKEKQDGQAVRQARALIEKLRSDDPGEREEANEAIIALGKAAEPELRKAVSDEDAEVAARVRRLLRSLLEFENQPLAGFPLTPSEAKAAQQLSAKHLGVPVEKTIDLGDGVKLELVLIPAGEVDMGSPEGDEWRYKDEGPVHRVRITKAFYMGKHEVTIRQSKKVRGYGSFGWSKPSMAGWDYCHDFLRRLNALGKGEFRLPTEAEWEYACRAGSAARYCFGDDVDNLGEYVWYFKNSEKKTFGRGKETHRVGRNPHSALLKPGFDGIVGPATG
jgi:formylglycine-generating enzyme required for sulfatase activity